MKGNGSEGGRDGTKRMGYAEDETEVHMERILYIWWRGVLMRQDSSSGTINGSV